jgi:hypothetical protein
VIIIVMIFLLAYTLAPPAVLPLALGVLLAGWVTPAPVPAEQSRISPVVRI